MMDILKVFYNAGPGVFSVFQSGSAKFALLKCLRKRKSILGHLRKVWMNQSSFGLSVSSNTRGKSYFHLGKRVRVSSGPAHQKFRGLPPWNLLSEIFFPGIASSTDSASFSEIKFYVSYLTRIPRQMTSCTSWHGCSPFKMPENREPVYWSTCKCEHSRIWENTWNLFYNGFWNNKFWSIS